MNNKIKACLFDFDGTLVDSMPSYSEKMLRLMTSRGIEPPQGIIRTLTPLGDMGAIAYLRENVGIDATPSELLAEMDAFADAKYRFEIPAKAHVGDYLRQLKADGIGVYLLTASPRRYFEPCLERLGLLGLFDDAWSCEDFSTTKSDPKIYAAAAERIGVKIDEIAFFDDNLNAVTTARSAGTYTVGVFDESSFGDKAAIRAVTDEYIFSMSELLHKNSPERENENCSFAIPERIEGEHIVLRKSRLSDADAMFDNFWSDTKIAETMFWEPCTSRDMLSDRIKRTVEFQKGKPAYLVADRLTDEPIGIAGIRAEADGVFSEAGIGIARKCQRRGYGKEVLALLLKLAFETFGAKRFVYYCMDTNEISKRLALGFGFRFDSAALETRRYDGREFLIEKYVLDRK